MKMRVPAVCVFLMLFAAVGVCSEGWSPDGNEILKDCQIAVERMNNESVQLTSAEQFDGGICLGSVSAVSDVSPKVCSPEHSTLGQAVRIVVKYLQDHPEELHLRHTLLIEKALSKAFPCSQH